MAEETLYCPSCNQKVRVPEEMLGQTVQCPLCRLVFTAPMRGAAPQVPPNVIPASGPAWGPGPMPPPQWGPPPQTGTPGSVKGPAIGLLVTGLIGLGANVLGLAMLLYIQANGVGAVEARVPPQFRELVRQSFPPETMGLQIAMRAIFLVVCALVALTGVQMLRLRAYWFAVVGSILAIVNFMEGCCCLGAPIGIWSLVVLFQPAVRSAFEQRSGPV